MEEGEFVLATLIKCVTNGFSSKCQERRGAALMDDFSAEITQEISNYRSKSKQGLIFSASSEGQRYGGWGGPGREGRRSNKPIRQRMWPSCLMCFMWIKDKRYQLCHIQEHISYHSHWEMGEQTTKTDQSQL